MPAHKHKHKHEHNVAATVASTVASTTTSTAAAGMAAKDAPIPAPRRPHSGADTAGTQDYPAAGPHARPELTDPEKTPGAGTLADIQHPRDSGSTG